MIEHISFCTSEVDNKITEFSTYIILTKKDIRSRVRLLLKALKMLPKLLTNDALVLKFPCEMRTEKLTLKELSSSPTRLHVIIARNENEKSDLNQ